MAETNTTILVDESRLPLLNSNEKELVSEVTLITNSDECAGTKRCPFNMGNIFGFIFQRITYYWIAQIAQFCQAVLQIFGYALSVSFNEGKVTTSTLFTGTQSFLICSLYNIMILGFISYLIVSHYIKGSELSKQRMTAGKHYQLSKSCAWMNIFCYIIIQPTVTKIMSATSDSRFSTLSDDVLPIIAPLIVGFQFVGMLACFTAATLTYRGAMRARGAEMVTDPEYKVPAWTLATTLETTGFTRDSGSIQLPA